MLNGVGSDIVLISMICTILKPPMREIVDYSLAHDYYMTKTYTQPSISSLNFYSNPPTCLVMEKGVGIVQLITQG